MSQRVTLNTAASSIVVVQRAYQTLCAPTHAAPVEGIYDTNWFDFTTIEVSKRSTVLATSPPAEDWLKFRQLVADWRQQRGAISSITEAALAPAYQAIIGMGPLAVPFILNQLASEGDEPDHWFWALKAITRANPVNDEDRGNLRRMARAWLEWAQLEGYAW